MNLCINCKHHRAVGNEHLCYHPDAMDQVTGTVGWPCYKLRWADGHAGGAHGGYFLCGPNGDHFEQKDSASAVHAAVRRSG